MREADGALPPRLGEDDEAGPALLRAGLAARGRGGRAAFRALEAARGRWEMETGDSGDLCSVMACGDGGAYLFSRARMYLEDGERPSF